MQSYRVEVDCSNGDITAVPLTEFEMYNKMLDDKKMIQQMVNEMLIERRILILHSKLENKSITFEELCEYLTLTR